MNYTEQTTVRYSWRALIQGTAIWIILAAFSWQHVGWFPRLVLVILIAILIAVWFPHKPYETTLSIADGRLSWDTLPAPIDILHIEQLLVDTKGKAAFRVRGKFSPVELPDIYDARLLAEHIQANLPHIKIVRR